MYPQINNNKNSTRQLAARIYSDLMNPLFMPPFVLFTIGLMIQLSVTELSWVVGISVVFYSLIPLLVTIYLLNNGYSHSPDFPEREKRSRLFLYAISSSVMGSFIMGSYFYLHRPLIAIIAAVFICNPIIGYLINLRWKISIHTASMGSAGAIFFYFYFLTATGYASFSGILAVMTLTFFLPGMIWARYNLRIHSLSELLGGATAGIILTLLELEFLRQLL